MNNELSAHIEYLLRRHDCVVIPGWGALLCNYVASHYDGDAAECGRVLLPPSRFIAFNALISDNDGMLAASVARRSRLSVAAASELVMKWVDELRAEFNALGKVTLGKLGTFRRSPDGEPVFHPEMVADINGPLRGLPALNLTTLAGKEAEKLRAREAADRSLERGEAVAERAYRSGSWRAYATGVVASLAVIVTVVLFAISPIRIPGNAQTASLVPTPSMESPAEAVEAMPDIEAIESGFGQGMALTLTPAPEKGVEMHLIAMQRSVAPVAAPAPTPATGGNFCVIVASFPSRSQAESYLAAHSAAGSGILAKDGKFRVYSASAATRAEAERMRAAAGGDAWVCHR